MNPQIHSRWGLLCPTCAKKLINPNQPWPEPCAVCGHRAHVKCLVPFKTWLVDLEVDDQTDFNKTSPICGKCILHGTRNDQLISQLPQASGTLPQDAFRAWKAKQPKAPKKDVASLWGDYRVDPDNFVPAVTKVLDIVHSNGPKVRWAVKLGPWQQVPMTNLSSKEIILPNYFDSPNSLGRTHQEVLDAMTGAAMHEAGHAAYDHAQTIIDAQKRIKAAPGQSAWASSTCLNIVCDYNLERKVIERYPAFRHFFTETHRWTVTDTLPDIVKALQDSDAQDKMNVRLGVLVWEMLGPGDLQRAGATITPKLKWITQKCFDILKYAYTKGYLNTEPGKLKTARALYELIRVVNPVGAPTNLVPVPQPQQPQGPQGSPQPPSGDPGDPDDMQGTPTPSQGQGQPQNTPPDTNQFPGEPDQESEQESDGSSGSGMEPPQGDQSSEDPGEEPDGDNGQPGRDDDAEAGSGSGEDQESPEDAEEEPGSEGQGSAEPDDTGTGTDPGTDGEALGDEPDSGVSGIETDQEASGQSSQSQNDDDANGGTEAAGDPDDSSSESDDAGESVTKSSGNKGGTTGSGVPEDPANDPFTGAGDLNDDGKRSNAKKDALDDLTEQNAGQDKAPEDPYAQDFNQDRSHEVRHREQAESMNTRLPINFPKVQDWQMPDLETYHAARTRELAPIISRLKKVLKFRNVDWGGQQTGRRSGTLTRRHVSRLSNFGSDKVFHKTQPDATPKVRIALLVDESESMRDEPGSPIAPYVAAKNAATAISQALHGIRGVQLWCWGFSMRHDYSIGSKAHVPDMRLYVDPYHTVNPATLEVSPLFGGTPTGEAMDYAAEVLCKNSAPDEKRVVFIVTDGEAGGTVSTATAVRKWTGKVTFVHIGIGRTVDKDIPFYVGPVTDITILPDLLSESVQEILK